MEESHQKVIDELQRKHQRELENLQEEKDRLLAEETAATIAGKSLHYTCVETRELKRAQPWINLLHSTKKQTKSPHIAAVTVTARHVIQ